MKKLLLGLSLILVLVIAVGCTNTTITQVTETETPNVTFTINDDTGTVIEEFYYSQPELGATVVDLLNNVNFYSEDRVVVSLVSSASLGTTILESVNEYSKPGHNWNIYLEGKKVTDWNKQVAFPVDIELRLEK